MRTSAGTRQLRSFGLMVGGVFSLLGLWPALVHHLPLRTWALVVGGLLILPAIVAPAILAVPYAGWMTLGRWLGAVNSRIILGLFFYLVLTPVGVIVRLAGKDPMRRRYDKKAASYRQTRAARPASHMHEQF